MLAVTVMLAVGVAEGKLLWYSYTRRDPAHTVQGLLLAERNRLAGTRVFKSSWSHADRFVLEHLVGGRSADTDGAHGFVREAGRGDYMVLSDNQAGHPEIVQIRKNRKHQLCGYPD